MATKDIPPSPKLDDALHIFKCMQDLFDKEWDNLLALCDLKIDSRGALARRMADDPRLYQQVVQALNVIKPDILECLGKEIPRSGQTPPPPPDLAKDFLVNPPIHIVLTEEQKFERVFKLFKSRACHYVIVTQRNGGELRGIISINDVRETPIDTLKAAFETSLEKVEWLRSDPIKVSDETDMETVFQKTNERKIQAVLVVDASNKPLGFITDEIIMEWRFSKNDG